MSEPEGEILERRIARLDRLHISIAGDLAWMEGLPADLAEFEGMASHRQSAARAVLKSFEQIKDQLSRACRAIPKLMGEDTRRWFGRNQADYMERFGLLDDAAAWSAVVKLRHQLIHDYPIDPRVQLARLVEAVGHLPPLAETHRRLIVFVRAELLGKAI